MPCLCSLLPSLLPLGPPCLPLGCLPSHSLQDLPLPACSFLLGHPPALSLPSQRPSPQTGSPSHQCFYLSAYSFARAAITRWHRNTRNWLSQNSGGQESQGEGVGRVAFSGGLSPRLADGHLPSPGVPRGLFSVRTIPYVYHTCIHLPYSLSMRREKIPKYFSVPNGICFVFYRLRLSGKEDGKSPFWSCQMCLGSRRHRPPPQSTEPLRRGMCPPPPYQRLCAL